MTAVFPVDTARRRRDDGTGMIGSLAAVVVFLSFLLLASHVLVGLYARSVVNAAGFDAARQVASRTVDHGDPASVGAAEARAEARLRNLLGAMGREAEVSWRVSPDTVTLRVRVDVPRVGVPGLVGATGLETVDRSFAVRVEDLR